MALTVLLSGAAHVAHAACGALANGVIPNPLWSPADTVTTIRAMAATEVGLAAAEGALAYDTTNDVVKACDGTNWNTVTGSGGSTGTTDRISSSGNEAMVLTMPGGTVSFTTGSVAGTSYLDSTGRWVGPGISITTANGISSTNGYFTRNVEIGTRAPSTLVISPSLWVSNPSNDYPFVLGNNKYLSWERSSGGFDGFIKIDNSNWLRMWTSGYSNPIELNGSKLLFQNLSGGNVGIGTTTPQATLQVSGSFTVSTSAQTTTPSLYVGTNGNVGVGTASPDSILTLAPIDYGASQAGGIRIQTKTGVWKWGIMARASGGGSPYLTIDGPADSSGNTISIMTLGTGENNGNVGIGTTSPAAKLHVVGTTIGKVIRANNSTGTGIHIGDNTANYFDANYNVFRSSTEVETMRIAGGNVGIGTTSPNAMLDVAGTVSSTSQFMSKNSAAPATCNATNEGRIAYTGGTTHYVCLCDGTSWKQMHDVATACTW